MRRGCAGHKEPDASGVLHPREVQAGGRMRVRLHDDVLEQLAKASFDGALVTAVHLEKVRN